MRLAIIQKFGAYQRERFPLVVLGLSLLPATLSSAAVMSVYAGASVVLALVASLAYLLHIRIIDEHRDFDHDNVHHAGRPIQSGVISQQELRGIDFIAIAIVLSVGAWGGAIALLLALALLAYSYLAGKEFYLGESLRRHFFLYNSVNIVQMLLMQVFVYTVFGNPFPFSTLLWAHFFFTTVGTLIFEFVRKLKVPGDDGTGRDTYTWHLGFAPALCIYAALIVLDTLLFVRLAMLVSTHIVAILALAAVLLCTALASTAYHAVHKTRQSDQSMQLSCMVLYGVCNLAIYFLMAFF